jgi:exodeoxyribonuclease V alpha subunit
MSIIVLIQKIIFRTNERNNMKLLVSYKNEEYYFYGTYVDWIEENISIIVYGKIDQKNKTIYSTSCIPYLERTLHSFKTFLIAAKIKILTKHKIETLIEIFGKDIISIFFEAQFEKLIPYINEDKIRDIKNHWQIIQQYSMLHLALYQTGLSPNSVKKLYKLYKEKALEKLKENPYQIIESVGYGFITADKIAKEYGIAPTASIRIESAILYALQKNESEGKSYLEISSLSKIIQELIEISLLNNELKDHLKELEKKDLIVIIDNCSVAKKKIYIYEQYIFSFFTENRKKPTDKIFPQKDSVLTEEQRSAITGAHNNIYTIITGSAGTGKSTCIKTLHKELKAEGKTVLILAPTGRAAQRIKEIIEEAPSMTIHKAITMKYIEHISQDPYFHDDQYLDYDHIIIDEASMIDAFLFYCLLKKITKKTAITLLGDKNQLPPIGPGGIFESCIETELIPIFRLTIIHRQAKNNSIIEVAGKVAEGIYPKISNSSLDDCYFESIKKEELAEKITTLIKKKEFTKEGFPPFQILTFLHKGTAGITSINKLIQDILQKTRDKKENEKIGDKFFIGDKVIVTKNNYELGISNGEIGYIESENEGYITVLFDEKKIIFKEENIHLLDLAYAISIHKSQGSEFEQTILLLYPEQYIVLNKKSLYTALTRGKKKVHIIGEKKTLFIALKKEYETKNHSLIPIIQKTLLK